MAVRSTHRSSNFPILVQVSAPTQPPEAFIPHSVAGVMDESVKGCCGPVSRTGCGTIPPQIAGR